MADRATFTVTNPRAPRECVAPDIRRMAEALAADAADNSPRDTGTLAAGFRAAPGSSGDPATSVVTNDVPYARFVEYGTRYRRADAPLGRAVAQARARMR